ncbi:MAG: tetratricopeptide repeat protein [Ferruginibacter sp.]
MDAQTIQKKNDGLLFEAKQLAISLAILGSLFAFLKIFSRFAAPAEERTVFVTYFNYVKLWESPRAYGFLSSAAKKKYENKNCFRPVSPWGNDWWNVMLDCSKKSIVKNSGGDKISSLPFTYTHIENGESANGFVQFVLERGDFKIDTIVINKIDKSGLNIVLKPSEQKKFDSLMTEGVLEFKKANVWKAYDLLGRALAINKWNADLNAYMGMCCGKIAGESKDIWDAINYGSNSGLYYKTALKIDSTNLLAHLGRGQGLLFAPPPYGNIQKSVADFEYVISRDEQNIDAYLFLGLAYERLKQKENAIRIYKKALRINPSATQISEQLEKIQ